MLLEVSEAESAQTPVFPFLLFFLLVLVASSSSTPYSGSYLLARRLARCLRCLISLAFITALTSPTARSQSPGKGNQAPCRNTFLTKNVSKLEREVRIAILLPAMLAY